MTVHYNPTDKHPIDFFPVHKLKNQKQADHWSVLVREKQITKKTIRSYKTKVREIPITKKESKWIPPKQDESHL